MLGRGSNNTLYPWVVFPQFWFSHVFSSNFSLRNSCHIWCTCMVSPQCGSSRVSSKQMIGWGSCNSLNTWIVFPQCLFYLSLRNSCHIWCTCMVSLQCGSSQVSSKEMIRRGSSNTCTHEWFFLSVCSLLCFQVTLVLKTSVTFGALEWFLSRVGHLVSVCLQSKW